jgi:hypothetical protein
MNHIGVARELVAVARLLAISGGFDEKKMKRQIDRFMRSKGRKLKTYDDLADAIIDEMGKTVSKDDWSDKHTDWAYARADEWDKKLGGLPQD